MKHIQIDTIHLIPIADLIFSLLLMVIPLILGLAHAYFKKKSLAKTVFEYYIFFGVGIQGVASGIMQTFYSDSVTEYVHWPFSPFMQELGLANISFGIIALISPWKSKGWQCAVGTGYACFLLFTGMRHLIEIYNQGFNPGNSGAFAYIDFAMAFILFLLLFITNKQTAFNTFIKKLTPQDGYFLYTKIANKNIKITMPYLNRKT